MSQGNSNVLYSTPFQKEILDIIFTCDHDGCIVGNESYDLEFKKSFGLKYVDDLFKTMNGLANKEGGYIICGIEPSTKKLIGLNDSAVELFDKIDSEQFRGKLFSCCQPNIDFKRHLHNIGTAKFFVFYVKGSKSKPHIFTQSMDEVKAGDIFYRYNDSIKHIQHAELSEIIELKRKDEQDKWMRFLGQIASIGLDSVLIVDCKKGKLIDVNGIDLNIDSGLFENLKFIKEGQFVELNGAPTLKLIGNAFIGDRTDLELSNSVVGVLNANDTHPYTQTMIYQLFIENENCSADKILLTRTNFSKYKIQALIALQNLKDDLNFIVALNYTGIVYKYSERLLMYLQDYFSKLTYAEIEAIKLPGLGNKKKKE